MTTSLEWPQLLFDLFRLSLNDQEVQVWHREIEQRFKHFTNDEVCGAIRLWAKDQPQARWRDCAGLISMVSQYRREQASRPAKPKDQGQVSDCAYCVKGLLHFSKLGLIHMTHDEAANNTVPCTCGAGRNRIRVEIYSGNCSPAEVKIYRDFAPEVRRWKDKAPEGSVHRPRESKKGGDK